MPFTAHSLKNKTSSEQETYSLFHSNVIILSLQLGGLSSSQATRTVPQKLDLTRFKSLKLVAVDICMETFS